jgi:two-component system cell cycle response regulator
MPARIVVIDDNPTNLDLMLYLMRAVGHEVVGFQKPAQGLAEAVKGGFDLVLSDIRMPDIDGYQIAYRLKAEPAAKSTPVIAVTALAMPGDRERIMVGGFDGYISKPIEPRTFVASVDRFLPAGLRSSIPAAHGTMPTQPRLPTRVGRTVLAIDDAQLNLDLLREMLEPVGYRVLEARGKQSAVQHLKAARPDLVLCDVHMPGDDGFAIIRYFKDDAALRDIPFIFLSSTAWSARDKKRGLDLGALHFIMRPIDPQRLLKILHEALSG